MTRRPRSTRGRDPTRAGRPGSGRGPSVSHRVALVALALWLGAATLFTALGGLHVAPAPFPQTLLAGLTGALGVGYALSPTFRDWTGRVPPRVVLAFHLTRFVGVHFLALYDAGRLPFAFAVLGGIGDIVVASLALLLLAVFRSEPRAGSPAIQVWNLLGLLDILFVVRTARRLALEEPGSMDALLELPLGLLPTFLVPCILFSHGVLLARGIRAWRGGN